MPETAQVQRVAILGLGKMGSILMQAFCRQKVLRPANISATVNHAERALRFPPNTASRSRPTTVLPSAMRGVILLCVKPQTLGDVVQEIEHDLRPEQLVISIAASVPTSYIEQRIPAGIAVIRAMPNTPSMVGAGMTAFCCGKAVKAADLETVRTFSRRWERPYELTKNIWTLSPVSRPADQPTSL